MSVWAARACNWASWSSGDVMGVWFGVGRVWLNMDALECVGGICTEEITISCSEGSGSVTKVIGTEEDPMSIMFKEGTTVISAACSTVREGSIVEKLGGGGLLSGGGFGFPN